MNLVVVGCFAELGLGADTGNFLRGGDDFPSDFINVSKGRGVRANLFLPPPLPWSAKLGGGGKGGGYS